MRSDGDASICPRGLAIRTKVSPKGEDYRYRVETVLLVCIRVIATSMELQRHLPTKKTSKQEGDLELSKTVR